MAKKENVSYKAETTSAFLNFLVELVNYVAVIATLILTHSLSIYMDLANSTCNFLRTGFTTILSKRLQKNLKYRYNYGTAKLETLSMIFCDGLLVLGTLVVLGFAIYCLFVPGEPNKELLAGVIFKSVCVFNGGLLTIYAWRIYKRTKTKVARTSFAATLGSLLFDAAILVSVLVSFIFSNWKGIVYVEPIASILIAIILIYKAIRRIGSYTKEIIDITISEKEQIIIDKLLAKYFDRYKDLFSVNSHKVGESIHVDFHISFDDQTPYSEIKETLKLFSDDLNKEFEDCHVSLIIEN